MLDLVQEEEVVSRTAGMSFDHLLALVDSASPADLSTAYEKAVDRYMVLAGRGKRNREEDLELDRLDTSLRMTFGKDGLLTFAARLAFVLDAVNGGLGAFKTTRSSAADLSRARLQLCSAASVCRGKLRRTPIPVDVNGMTESLNRAQKAARALIELRGELSLLSFFYIPARTANKSVELLASELLEAEASNEPWLAVADLLDPRRTTPRQRVERVVLCFQLGGLAACAKLRAQAQDGFAKAAELVRGGLGI